VVHTLTLDNGKEFAGHECIAHKSRCRVYFADPYSSYQRGTNENTNGLLRQYFPKSSDFSKLTVAVVNRVSRRSIYALANAWAGRHRTKCMQG
jgi:IS30 family transposase